MDKLDFSRNGIKHRNIRDFLMMGSGMDSMGNSQEYLSSHDVDIALAEIERTLDQMLMLAQMSASDLAVDRNALQKALERLQRKIDNIADHL